MLYALDLQPKTSIIGVKQEYTIVGNFYTDKFGLWLLIDGIDVEITFINATAVKFERTFYEIGFHDVSLRMIYLVFNYTIETFARPIISAISPVMFSESYPAKISIYGSVFEQNSQCGFGNVLGLFEFVNTTFGYCTRETLDIGFYNTWISNDGVNKFYVQDTIRVIETPSNFISQSFYARLHDQLYFSTFRIFN